MTRVGSAIVLTLLFACASDKQTDAPNTAPRGSRHRAHGEQGAAVAPGEEQPAQEPIAEQAVAKAADAKPPEKEKRDYGAELLAAVGSPVDCLKPRTAGPDVPGRISIVVDATVTETGLVTRGYASSSQLDAEELKCVEQRLATLRMRGPIEDAPRSVRATVELALQPPATKPDAAEARGAYGGTNEPAAMDGIAPAPRGGATSVDASAQPAAPQP
jgi:hypothetical protein